LCHGGTNNLAKPCVPRGLAGVKKQAGKEEWNMEESKITQFMLSNRGKFSAEGFILIERKLKGMDDSKFDSVCAQRHKKPVIIFVISLFLGWLGIDRFVLGQIVLGIAKLVLFICSLICIWMISVLISEGPSRGINFGTLLTSSLGLGIFLCVLVNISWVWWILDWLFFIEKATKAVNLEKFMYYY
jgi:hypothetical protein